MNAEPVHTMREFVDSVMETGYVTDPGVVYDSTPSDILRIVNACVDREQYREQLEFIRTGSVIATLANIHRPRRSSRTYMWQDVFPPFHDAFKPQPQTVESMKAVCRDLCRAAGGEIKKGGK